MVSMHKGCIPWIINNYLFIMYIYTLYYKYHFIYYMILYIFISGRMSSWCCPNINNCHSHGSLWSSVRAKATIGYLIHAKCFQGSRNQQHSYGSCCHSPYPRRKFGHGTESHEATSRSRSLKTSKGTRCFFVYNLISKLHWKMNILINLPPSFMGLIQLSSEWDLGPTN